MCVTDIQTEDRFYDFDAKYKSGGSTHIIPAEIDEQVAKLLCCGLKEPLPRLGAEVWPARFQI